MQSPAPTTVSAPHIRTATTPADWHAVHRLRYECFVAENGQGNDTADHERRLLADELDALSTTLVAQNGDEVVGTLRFQTHSLERLSFRGLFGIDAAGNTPDLAPSAVISKLAVAQNARGARVMRAIVCAAYLQLLDRSMQVAWIGCAPHLERFYRRLGFLPNGPTQFVPGYGAILPMRLDLLDAPHLQQVGSPLASLCAAFVDRSRRSA